MKRSLHLQNNRYGFSLVEILVAIVVIGLLVIVLSQSLLSTIRSNMKAEIVKEVKENGDYVQEYIGRLIRNAKRVSIPGITCQNGKGGSGSTIDIINLDNKTTTVTCDTTAKKISVSTDGTTTPITSSNVEADCSSSAFSFTCTSASGTPSTIAFQFKLTQKGLPPDKFEQAGQVFTSTVTLRNK